MDLYLTHPEALGFVTIFVMFKLTSDVEANIKCNIMNS